MGDVGELGDLGGVGDLGCWAHMGRAEPHGRWGRPYLHPHVMSVGLGPPPGRDTLVITIGNCCTSFFAGFAIFSVLGHMAWKRQVPVGSVVDSGGGSGPGTRAGLCLGTSRCPVLGQGHGAAVELTSSCTWPVSP